MCDSNQVNYFGGACIGITSGSDMKEKVRRFNLSKNWEHDFAIGKYVQKCVSLLKVLF